MDCAAELDIDDWNLMCPACLEVDLKNFASGMGCEKHGVEYGVFKFSLCCGVASWHCGVGLFYCSACHGGSGESTPCLGDDCPIKVLHAQCSMGSTIIASCSACELNAEESEVAKGGLL
jgi:hypothetical protein